MRLTTLRVTNFRNFTDQRLTFPPAGVAIVGDNGQGKTNLLESIYYLQIFRSFRGAPDEQLVRFGEEVFRIDGTIEGVGGGRRITAAYDRKRRKKKVAVDGVELPRLADGLGRLAVVIFSPSDVSIVSGAPGNRRRFLDILLSLTEPRYLEHLQRYRQILQRRNLLLREGAAAEVVAAFDAGLAKSGSEVTAARMRWVAARAGAFVEHMRRIAGGGDASLEYESSVPVPAGDQPLEPAAIAEIYADELARVAERERRRGMSLVGPHRDDLRIRSPDERGGEWVDLRVYGSGGQQRTAAVALRMIEGETLRDTFGSEPVILLDDVFAELDVGRSERIIEWLEREDSAQVILTTPKRGDLRVREGTLQTWRISRGRIEPL